MLTTMFAFLMLLVFTIPGCRSNAPSPSGPTNSNELTVSAAVSLKDAFNEIADLNERRTGTKIHFNYGASGALQKQIETGAPVDVFASAGAKQMDDLAARGLIVPATPGGFCAQLASARRPAQWVGY